MDRPGTLQGHPADCARRCRRPPLGGAPATSLRLGGRALRSRALRRRLATGAARTLRSSLQLRLASRLRFSLCCLGHVFSLSLICPVDSLPKKRIVRT